MSSHRVSPVAAMTPSPTTNGRKQSVVAWGSPQDTTAFEVRHAEHAGGKNVLLKKEVHGWTDTPEAGINIQECNIWKDLVRLQLLVVKLTSALILTGSLVTGDAAQPPVLYVSGSKGLLTNMTASFAAIVTVLGMVGLGGVSFHAHTVLARYELLQCVPAAIAAVATGVLALVSVWLLRLLRQCHDQLKRLMLLKVKQRWASPTPQEHAAATRVQCNFRSKRARVAAVRAAEYTVWYKHSQQERALTYINEDIVALAVTATTCYVNSGHSSTSAALSRAIRQTRPLYFSTTLQEHELIRYERLLNSCKQTSSRTALYYYWLAPHCATTAWYYTVALPLLHSTTISSTAATVTASYRQHSSCHHH
eukprot:20953-Heterococcus_DN1.PRE.1